MLDQVLHADRRHSVRVEDLHEYRMGEVRRHFEWATDIVYLPYAMYFQHIVRRPEM